MCGKGNVDVIQVEISNFLKFRVALVSVVNRTVQSAREDHANEELVVVAVKASLDSEGRDLP